MKKESQEKARYALMRYKEEQDLTQEQLARKLGVVRATVASWLGGRTNFSGIALELLKVKGILK